MRQEKVQSKTLLKPMNTARKIQAMKMCVEWEVFVSFMKREDASSYICEMHLNITKNKLIIMVQMH